MSLTQRLGKMGRFAKVSITPQQMTYIAGFRTKISDGCPTDFFREPEGSRKNKLTSFREPLAKIVIRKPRNRNDYDRDPAGASTWYPPQGDSTHQISCQMQMIPEVQKRKTSLVWFTKIFIRIFLSPHFQLKISGLERLPKKTGFVLLPKHQRWEDIPLLSLATPRPLYYVAKQELFRNPLSGWLMSALGGIPLNRSRPIESRRSLRALLNYLKAGEGVVVFPEGTYQKNMRGPGHLGVIRMIRSGFRGPFFPVGLSYKKKGGRWLVRIIFGTDQQQSVSVRDKDFLDQIMKEIGRLSDL